jgi:thioredoxin reductase
VRIKERNEQKLNEFRRSGKIEVVLRSIPVEIAEKSVTLNVDGETTELPNDYVWVFAGGVAPNDFLKKIGVGFGSQDLTAEVSREALAAREEGVNVR